MPTCPNHRHAAPPTPQNPHTTRGNPRFVCKGCGAPQGSDAERAAHHCPCCGERYTSCRTRGRTVTCPNCGRIDADGTWMPALDPLRDLLEDRKAPSGWYRAWLAALDTFGPAIAHHLQPAQKADTTRQYGQLTVGTRTLELRRAKNGQFEAATPCPRDDCHHGRLWTPVHSTTDLHTVYTHGPRTNATTCDRSHRHTS